MHWIKCHCHNNFKQSPRRYFQSSDSITKSRSLHARATHL